MDKDILYPLRRLHGILYNTKVRQGIRKNYKLQFKKHPNSAFFIMTPEHSNLGDHAIALAVAKLLNDNNIRVIEITEKKLCEMSGTKQLGVFNGMPVIVNGGGNLGTLWFSVEKIFRTIIAANPRSKIMLFPNTIFYEDSENGKTEFENSKRIYNKHRWLYLCAREKISYDIMKDAYNHVKLVPDMVLSLNECRLDTIRSGCLLCLRNDIERTRTEEEDLCIEQQARQVFGDNVRRTDMCADYPIPVDRRDEELEKKFNEFRNAELIITDRLHGMIFCAITGTPCIVVDSKSPKVRGCYEWIKHLDYIRFADDVSDIEQEYNKIPKSEHIYDNSHLKHYYDKLAQDILNIL